MRSKIITFFLALVVMTWAHSAMQANPSTAQQSATSSEKAKCPCCEKMAGGDMKDMKACCAHHDAMAGDDKEMASHPKQMASCCSKADKKDSSCCAGKDGASCMRDKDATAKGCGDNCSKDKTAASCCGDSCREKCTKEGKSCCSSQKKSAKNCCSHPSHA